MLDRLLDKSLVLAEHTPAGMRYSMLQTLQDYASERLAESGEREHVVDRHAHYYAGMVAGALKGLVGHDQAEWLATIGRERAEHRRRPRVGDRRAGRPARAGTDHTDGLVLLHDRRT